MLYKKFIVLFVVGLHSGALQSMNPSDSQDFTPSNSRVLDLTNQFEGLTTTESNNSTDSDQLELSAAQVRSYESNLSYSKNLASAAHIEPDLDDSYDCIRSALDSSALLQSPSGLKSDDFQSAMHGISTNTSGGGNRIGYASRNRSGASAGSSFGCCADKKENNNSWNTDDRRGTKRRSIEAKKHADNQDAQAKIATVISQVAQSQGVMASAQKHEFIENYNHMGYTPGDSKKNIGIDFLSMLDAVSCSDLTDSTSKNKRKREWLKSNPSIEKCVGTVAQYIPSPEVRSFAVVNTEHVTDGDCILDAGKISSVSGLHSLENAQKQKLLHKNQYVFIGQDNKTIGVLLGNKVAKSMKDEMTAEDVIAAFQQGKTVAKIPDIRNFKMSQIQDGTFVGSYHVPSNPAVCSTLYPLLVVNGTEGLLNNKDIYVGRFAQLDSNGKPTQTSLPNDLVFVKPLQFKAMMAGGKSFKVSKDYEGFTISDITSQMQEHCHKKLDNVGMSQLPEIVGICDDNKLNK